MGKEKVTFFEKLVYIAYGYYILLGATWFLVSLIMGHYFSYQAFSILVIFAAQAYYQHKLTNLILGVLLFGASIFCALEFVWEGGKTGFDGFIYTMEGLCIGSIVMAGILVFGYMKLSFLER